MGRSLQMQGREPEAYRVILYITNDSQHEEWTTKYLCPGHIVAMVGNDLGLSVRAKVVEKSSEALPKV